MRDFLAGALAPVLALLGVSFSAGPTLDFERAKSDAAGAVAYAALAVDPRPQPPKVAALQATADHTDSADGSASSAASAKSAVLTKTTPPPASAANVLPAASVRFYTVCSGGACRRGRLFRR